MKNNILFKILISVVVIVLGVVSILLITPNNDAIDNGSIYVYITNIEEVVIYEGILSYEKGDSFYDILNNHFDLTCADRNYKPSSDCGYTFNNIAYQGKIILGIAGNDFSIMSDWENTFISFYSYIDEKKTLLPYGVSQIPFKDGEQFYIGINKVTG